MYVKGTILHKSVQILARDDDGVTVQKYENAIKGAFNKLEMEEKKGGSVINYDKAKNMENGKPKKEKCIKRKYWRYRESQSV